MAEIEIPADIKAMKFEESMAELEVMMRKLDVGGMTMEDATDCYIRSCLLHRHCNDILDNLKKKILLYTNDKQWENFAPGSSRNQAPDPLLTAAAPEKETGSEEIPF